MQLSARCSTVGAHAALGALQRLLRAFSCSREFEVRCVKEELLLALAASPRLARVNAARSNLSGTIPNLLRIKAADVDREVWNWWVAPLSRSLQTLNVEQNRITQVEGFSSTLLNLARQAEGVQLAPKLLQKALRLGVEINLEGTSLTNTSEPLRLLRSGRVKRTLEVRKTDKAKGYACYGLNSQQLLISPDLFLPEELCGCLPGWEGNGTNCRQCLPGRYNEDFNQSQCMQCPDASDTASVAASSVDMCLCDFGRIHPKEPGDAPGYRCACNMGQALHGRACVACGELHLNCSGVGNVATSVAPEQGWARLAPKNAKTFRCLEPAATRCTSSKDGQCAPGYAGPLCISCAEGSHSAGHLCKPCAAGPRKRALGAALVLGVAGLAIAGFVWRRRASEPEPSAGVPDAKKAALALLVSQGPLLLQLGQLWVVVAKLGTTKLDTKAEKGFAVAFWEQPYVQWLQLSAQGLQDALSLECSYGSAQTRFWGAVLSPLAPLALLALCGLVELFSRSSGISLAIKALTLFFIGGATSCAQLLSCQDTDGGGNLLGEHAFRLAMPELKCSVPSW
ncbi:unnamed protein product, partial [Effrenium voratum]